MPKKNKKTRYDEAKEWMQKLGERNKEHGFKEPNWNVDDHLNMDYLEDEINAMIQGFHVEVGFEMGINGERYLTYHTTWDANAIDIAKWFPNQSEDDLEGHGMSEGVKITYPSSVHNGCSTLEGVLGQVLEELVPYLGMREMYERVSDLPMAPQEYINEEVA